MSISIWGHRESIAAHIQQEERNSLKRQKTEQAEGHWFSLLLVMGSSKLCKNLWSHLCCGSADWSDLRVQSYRHIFLSNGSLSIHRCIVLLLRFLLIFGLKQPNRNYFNFYEVFLKLELKTEHVWQRYIWRRSTRTSHLLPGQTATPQSKQTFTLQTKYLLTVAAIENALLRSLIA